MDKAGSVVRDPVRDLRVGARRDRGAGLMPAKLTQAEVDAWLAEHRPDFVERLGLGVRKHRYAYPRSCRVDAVRVFTEA